MRAQSTLARADTKKVDCVCVCDVKNSSRDSDNNKQHCELSEPVKVRE